MARQKPSNHGGRRRSPARTPEAREQQVADAAYDLAEDQIHSGTASSQVITHFLKAGSMRERLEQQRMEHEIELMEVKKAQIESQQRIEELYMSALDAMRSYSGMDPEAELDPGEEI